MKIGFYLHKRRIGRRKLLLLLVFLFIIFLRWQERTGNTSSYKSPEKPKTNELSSETKLILLYTTLFQRTTWPDFEHDYQMRVSNCHFTYNKSALNQSSAVIFHGIDMEGLNIRDVSKSSSNRRNQHWVFFIQENPTSFVYDYELLDGVFNLTMTYKYDSDIFLPYNYYRRRSKGTGMGRPAMKWNYAAGKDRVVAWMSSNCGVSLRNSIVRKLMKYIDVDVYGGCSPMFDQQNYCVSGDDGKCHKTLKRYKFYLALENTDCVDYITEKYWRNSLLNGIVPVVFGGGNYSDRNLVIPGSYINILDFASFEDLAKHLHMLDKNDTAYNEYFEWRKTYIVRVQEETWMGRLCSMLNDKTRAPKVYDKQTFETFYSKETNCGVVQEKINQIINHPYSMNSSIIY